MKVKRSWLDRLEESLDLPGEDPPGQPIVEIAGGKRVLIEHHQGVVQYESNEIRVKVRFGILLIQGCGMELARMTRDQLVICGRIDSVTVCRRG